MKRFTVKSVVFLVFCQFSLLTLAQEKYTLQSCVDYALEYNHALSKSKLDRDKSMAVRREVLGSLLPQVNASGGLNYSIQKAKFIMPNFVNSMLPPAMQDPTAAKYMTIEMGTDWTANVGATLSQQVLNFSLFNAVDIAKITQEMTELGVETKEEDIIAQTATLFYGIQVTEYAVMQFSHSINLLDSMLTTMEGSYKSGLVKKVDVDRLRITKTNLETQRSSIANSIEIQKNLLKLQMGMDMSSSIALEPINISRIAQRSNLLWSETFDIGKQTSYRMIKTQEKMGELQRRSAVYESLPSLVLNANYQWNFVCDDFFTGPTLYKYPQSGIGLALRVPIFAGLTRSNKLKEAKFEQLKIKEDELSLTQALTMSFMNAQMKLDDNRKTIKAQEANKQLAEDVYKITENNYTQGLASISDLLNSNSSLIQAQISYVSALNDFMKAYIDLKKSSGNIRTILE